MNLAQIHDRVENLKGQRQQLAADIAAGNTRLVALRQDAVDADEARAIIQAVAKTTQQSLEFHVSEVVSLALAAVFDRPYALRLEFVARRNKTEADIFFERDGERVKPVDASGGGAVDVAALGLRVAVWSLRRPRSRATLVLDEPFKHLKGSDANLRVLRMVKELSTKMGVQFIMVSDERIPRAEIVANADRVFETTIDDKGVSHVESSETIDSGTTRRNQNDESSEKTASVSRRSSRRVIIEKSTEEMGESKTNNDRQDRGDKDEEQQKLDGYSSRRHARGSEGNKDTPQEDNSKRQAGVETHSKPRRRRT